MPVNLSDAEARFLLEALEANVLLCVTDSDVIDRALELETKAYNLMCRKMGFKEIAVYEPTTSSPEPHSDSSLGDEPPQNTAPQ
jgi:hypothetical protein